MRDLLRVWRLLPKAAMGLLIALELVWLAGGESALSRGWQWILEVAEHLGESTAAALFLCLAIGLALAGTVVAGSAAGLLRRGVRRVIPPSRRGADWLTDQPEERAVRLLQQSREQVADYYVRRTVSIGTSTKQQKFYHEAGERAIEGVYDHLALVTNRPLLDALMYHDQLVQDQNTLDYMKAEADAVQSSWIGAALLPFCIKAAGGGWPEIGGAAVAAVVWIVLSVPLCRMYSDAAAYYAASWLINAFTPGEIDREEAEE